jgi:YggT family protein
LTYLIINIIFNVVGYVLTLIFYAVILSAIVSTLLAFNVLDSRNRTVWSIADFLYRVTDPILRPLRRVLPTVSGIDFSPWVAILLIQMVAMPLLGGLHDTIRQSFVQPVIVDQ